MNQPYHSPLPWKTNRLGKHLYVEAAIGGLICDMQLDDAVEHEKQQVRDDANYIVIACNLFPKLVEAIECLLKQSPGAREKAIAVLEEMR